VAYFLGHRVYRVAKRKYITTKLSKKLFKIVLKSANKIRFIRQIKEMIKHYNIMRRY